MPEWLLQSLAASGPLALIAVGGLFVKVARLERDMDTRVTRELFDVHMKMLEKELAEIKGLLMSRRALREDTDPGVNR